MGLSCSSAGRSHLTLLFYMCSLPPLIQMERSDLFSHSLFVNHPLAAAKVNQLLPPELAVQKTVIQSKDSKKWQRERAELAARGQRFDQPHNLWHLSVTQCQQCREPCSLLRSITFMSRSVLVQLKGRPWKNTQDSWKHRQKLHICRSSAPFPSKKRPPRTTFPYFPLD